MVYCQSLCACVHRVYSSIRLPVTCRYHYYGLAIKETSIYYRSVYSKKGLTRLAERHQLLESVLSTVIKLFTSSVYCCSFEHMIDTEAQCSSILLFFAGFLEQQTRGRYVRSNTCTFIKACLMLNQLSIVIVPQPHLSLLFRMDRLTTQVPRLASSSPTSPESQS